MSFSEYSFSNYFTIVSVLSIIASSRVCWAAAINETCRSNTDCSAQSSLCGIASPTCGGSCQCIPGFALDTQTGNCKRAAYLGGQCNAKSDVCVGSNVVCTNSGTCACSFGFKTGLQGTDCVPNLMEKTAGQTCHDSAQCYYTLVCLSNKCGCYPGYKAFGKYSCSPRQVYDSCSSDDDCQQAPNSQCVNGRCDCVHGYRAIQYQAEVTSKAYVCIGGNDGIASEGERCNLDANIGNLVYCKVPFVCSRCGSSNICLRVMPVLLADESSLLIANSRLIVAFVIFASFFGVASL